MAEALTEAERFPLLTEDGRRLLQWLYENEFAPRYNHHCGDRLNAAGLARVIAFDNELYGEANGWEPGGQPAWLADFAAQCLADVPFYRRYGVSPDRFADIPTCTRRDLSREPWSFVPDSQSLDDLIVYSTSGTTGGALDIPSHPEAAATYLPLLRYIAARHGVTLVGGAGRVAIVLVCYQKHTLTYASISSLLNQAGVVKINLHPGEWRAASDRARFLDACHPEIYTGDPVSFAELATLPMQTRPKALLSTAMTLTAGLRASLEKHFGCPVIDVYSLNESGPVAVAQGDGHAVLPHHIYVEVLRSDGTLCPPGERGEITLSGGFNPYLPLLHYRTGDHASLEWSGRLPRLAGLAGRAPVTFRSITGQVVNNVDVGQVLKPFALAQFNLHQFGDGSLRLRTQGPATPAQLREALLALFGADQPLTIESVEDLDEKLMPYTRDEP